MLTCISQYIKKHAMFPAGSRVLIGVSGGADSVALLHILCALREKLHIEPVAAHFHHGIRGEADGDEQFVADFCAALGVPLVTGRADVPALSREEGLSLEVAAREARHAFFRKTMAESNCSRLALAHHRDDQAETVLLRLIRGAGTSGLGAMAPVEAGGIVRPLLDASREDIRSYCRENRLDWREDATNRDISIPRNWVRHALLPMLREHANPSLEAALCRTAELLRQDEDCLDALAGQALLNTKQKPGGGVSMAAAELAALHPAVRSRALRQLIARAGLHTDVEFCHIAGVESLLADGKSGRRTDLGSGFVAMREGGNLVVTPALSEEVSYPPVKLQVPGKTRAAGGVFICEVLENAPADWIHHVNSVQYFDCAAFPGDAVARSRLPGDRFHPLGAAGGKKLKEYLIDRKTGRWGRGGIPVLASGGDILWVVGHAIADTVRITDTTACVIKITYINGEEQNEYA